MARRKDPGDVVLDVEGFVGPDPTQLHGKREYLGDLRFDTGAGVSDLTLFRSDQSETLAPEFIDDCHILREHEGGRNVKFRIECCDVVPA